MNPVNFIANVQIHSCGMTDCPPDWSWNTGPSGFSDYDLWTVFRGNGTLTANGKEYQVSRGSSMLLFPNTHYIGVQDSTSPLFVIHIHFTAASPLPVPKEGVLAFQLSNAALMRDLLQHSVNLFYRGEQELANILLRAALTEYFTQNRFPDEQHSLQISRKQMIEEICDGISASPGKAPSLSDLSLKYGYSKDYLGRLFFRETGISFSEFVKKTRINKACLLLDSTDRSIQNIADELSFYDVCYFSRQFKAVCGLSPNAYRKKKQQDPSLL